jgi:hypothetical protein
MRNIKSIYYPNTVKGSEQSIFTIGKNCDEIKTIPKGGEMGIIQWFQIIKNNKIIAEIKESVCDIYGEDEVEEIKDVEEVKDDDLPF